MAMPAQLYCNNLSFSEICAPLNLDLITGERLAVLVADEESALELLQTLVGLRPPRSGERLLFTETPESLAPTARRALRRRLGIVADKVGLVSNLTVLENLLLPATYPGGNLQQLQAAALTTLQKVGFDADADLRPGELRQLQKRQVLLARALLGAPELLLYVDLLTGLSARERAALLNAIAAVGESSGAASLFICSDPAQAGRFGVDVCDLLKGENP